MIRCASRLMTLAVLTLLPAFCQINKGSLTGVVTDPRGAAVPGASVSLVETRTGVKSDVLTDSTGTYSFAALSLGDYTITVTQPSFRTFVQSGIGLNAGDRKRIDIQLELGEVTQRVTVTGAAPILDVQEPTYTNTEDTRTLSKLPLLLTGVKRDPSQFMATLPGYQGGAGFSDNFNGSIGTYSELLVDGASVDTNPAVHGSFRNGFSSEALAEFKLAETPSADLGSTGGVVMSFVTKSGTNDFHGSAYEYLRNNALDARDFFSPTVPKDVQNEFGFTIGGPVILGTPKHNIYNGRDKTFFFFNYGQSRYRFGAGAATYTLPTEAFRRGDFSSILGNQVGVDALGRPVRQNAIYDPTTTRSDGKGGFIRDPFPNNVIPEAQFSQVSSKFQSFYPTLPAGAPLVNNYVTSGGAGSQDNTYYSIKVDQYVKKDHFSVLYWRDTYTSLPPFTLPDIFGIRNNTLVQGHNARINWTKPISPRLVNDAIGGIDRDFINTFSPGDAGNGAALIGQKNALGRCLPAVHIPGFFSSTQTELKCGQIEGDTNWRFVDNVSFFSGKHSIKFGGQYYKWTANFPVENNAQFTFSSAQTGLPGFLNNTGFPYASFLLGGVSNSDAKGQELQTPRIHAYGFYVQDNYRLSPKFTLELGLRWDIQPFPVHQRDAISQFDPDLPNPGADGRPGALTFAGTGPGRLGTRQLSDTHYRDFGPRVGFAWHALSKTVVRGNWGLYYGPINQQMAGFAAVIQQGFFPLFSRASLDGFSAPFNWDNGFPVPPNPEAPNLSPTVGNGSNTAYFGADAGRSPRIQSVHFGIEHELPGRILVEGSFLGKYSHGIISGASESINQLDYAKYRGLGDLLGKDIYSQDARNANIPVPYSGFQGTVAQALRPFPQYLNIFNEGGAVGNATYNGFQLKVQKQYSHGLSFLVGYTIGKNLTDLGGGSVPGFFAAAPQDAYNRRAEKSLSDIDIPQSLLFNYVYELPVGPGKKFVNSNHTAARLIFGGWAIAGYHTYNSGTPIAVTTERVLPTMGGFLNPVSLRPDIVSGVPIRTNIGCGSYDPGRGDRYLNVGAFADPAPLMFGSASRNLPNVRGCAQFNENVSLQKSFYIKESVSLRFGADFFNILNRHPWGGPATDIDNPGAFGTISSTGAGRHVQLHGRFEW